MLDVVIVGDHPTLHGGFATVGREVARSLHARGASVRYVARYADDAAASTEPYEVLRQARSLLDTLDRATGRESGVVLLSIGGLGDHAEVLATLRRASFPAPEVLIAYLAVDSAPLPTTAGPTLDQADVLVPYNLFGAQAIRKAGTSAVVAPPIPHGVDPDIFTPLAPDERHAVRHDRFDLTEHDFLVGFFGRNCGHKRPDLALRVFAAWVNGETVRCHGCGMVVELPLTPTAEGHGTLRCCPHCGSDGPFRRQPPQANARLYLHSELLTRQQRRISGGWDLQRIARRLGVDDKVVFDPSLQVGRGVAGGELARRMAACDVHLLPYEGGAWELTVLETAACGVPNVITDAAAPPGYAAPFSILIPPRMRVPGPRGARALMDVGRAVAALQQLSDSPQHRKRLGRRGVETARAHRWDRIGEEWFALLQHHLGRDVDTVGRDAGKDGLP